MKTIDLGKYSLALAALLLAAIPVNATAQPPQPLCGDTIFSDTALTDDLLGCPSRGLRIGADNVTLNCDGNTIEAAGNRVVEVNFGLSNVTVQNCVLVSTANTDALRVNNGTNISIIGNEITTSGTQSRGIRLNSTSMSLVENNKVTTTGQSSDGIRLSGSPENHVIDNQVTTAGETARGFRIESGASDNLILANIVRTTGLNSSGMLIRSGSDGNVVELNSLRVNTGQSIRIESSSNNLFIQNTLETEDTWLRSRRTTLQNGGLSVHPNGRLFAVENNFGSSSGIGTSTALIEFDPVTNQVVRVRQITEGNNVLGFGFDALEITSDGRFLATRGGSEFRPTGELYEISLDPVNPDNAMAAFLFPLPKVNGLQSSGDGLLLATTNQGEIFNIDLSTGVFTSLGDFGVGWTDIAVHPSSGRVFVLTRHIQEESATNHLYEIDFGLGTATEVGDTGEAFISDIDFAADDTMYANGSGLLKIDPNTAATERIGAFGEDPFEPPSENNLLTDTTLNGLGGSVHYPGDLLVPPGVATEVSTNDLNISFNRIFVDSGAFPFLNVPATLTLTNLSGSKRVPVVDPEDDGTFMYCGADRCSPVSFSGGTLQFDVTGFTTYSSRRANRGMGPGGSGPPGTDGNGPPGLLKAPGPDGDGPPGL